MSAPENFKSIVHDFSSDLLNTFPEFDSVLAKLKDPNPNEIEVIYKHCLTVYPERFFDIIYQNADIFSSKSEVETNTMFLPGLDFKLLFNCEGVSDKTKQVIWKYLQLILFNVVGSVEDKSKFGDTAAMFDGIDENMLHEKLQETILGLGDFFKDMGAGKDTETGEGTGEDKREFTFDPKEGIPNMDEMHEHLKGIFDGKIGKLAKELAEEVSGDFTDIMGDMGETTGTTQDVLKRLMKNPKKMMGLVKKVGDKLTQKMDSGEISKDEIMKEATDIMAKMREMGGGSDKLNEMLKKFAGGLGKDMKVDVNAMDRMTQKNATKERMRAKMEERKKGKDNNYVVEPSAQPNTFVYRVPGEEVQQRSSIQQKIEDDKLIAELGGDIVKSAQKSAKKPKANKKK
jgi:hypothetical protein